MTAEAPANSPDAPSKPCAANGDLVLGSAESLPSKESKPEAEVRPSKKGWRFYTILVSIGFSGLLTALEATITSTALPSIVAELGGGDSYVWVANGYFLAMAAFQPLYGQLANVFGRRWPTVLATALFVFGSGLCGGANHVGMLIAGRVIQGIGAAGINVLCEVVVCDLVPLRERGKYLAAIFGLIAIGTALGPFFGGLLVDHGTWRWVFYLNLPVGGLALVLLLLFLQVKYKKDDSLATSLGRIDWLGNAIFVAAVASILLALSWAGAIHPWASYQVVVPLVVGCVGLVGFLFFESSRFAPEPTMPLHLLSNRTSATAFGLTFLHSIVTIWALYFLPVYFQGVLASTPSRSGVKLLPTILILIPFAMAGGAIMSKTGLYRPGHAAGFALMVVGFGLFSLLDETSSTGSWVGFQMVESAGAGLVIPTLLPAVLAPLAESDTALATATWSFIRSFGLTWGTAVAAAVFNNRFSQVAADRITDPQLAALLSGGKAYQYATREFVLSLPETTRRQFVSAVNDSLKRSWFVAIAFAALGVLLVLVERDVPLRQELETEYGIKEKKEKEKDDVEAQGNGPTAGANSMDGSS